MKLYLLKAREDLPDNETNNPWKPWYDKSFGFVIRASNELSARQFAHENAGEENNHATPWLCNKYSTCVELLPEGKAGVILKRFCCCIRSYYVYPNYPF